MSNSEDLTGVQFVNGTRPGNPQLVELALSLIHICVLAWAFLQNLFAISICAGIGMLIGIVIGTLIDVYKRQPKGCAQAGEGRKAHEG